MEKVVTTIYIAHTQIIKSVANKKDYSMQIKTADGVMRLVAQCLILKAMLMLPKHLMNKMLWLKLSVLMLQKAHNYMHKAASNIKRISEVEDKPCTEDDVKNALAKVLRHGNSCLVADAIYLAIEFLCARFIKHLISKYSE